MRKHDDQIEPDVDEYLWPLTGELSPINWEALAEELHIRDRLAVIMAHVRELHLEPRLRRLGAGASADMTRVLTETVIAGPESGPPWEQRLRDPVPRALREEWEQLSRRLCELDRNRHKRVGAFLKDIDGSSSS